MCNKYPTINVKMKFIAAAIFYIAFIIISGNNVAVALPPEPPSNLVSSSSSTTATPPTPTSTTTATTTTTTEKPSPPTPPPPTPTPTPPPKTTTTTTTPAPTTTVAPPAPTPMPTPHSGQWIVNGTNKTCIIVKMTAQFNVTYLTNENKTVFRQIVLPISNSTNVTGVCDENEQVINITWGATEKEIDSLIIHFVKNVTEKNYFIHHVEMYLSVKELPNIKTNNTVMLIHNMSEYKTALGNSYRCAKLQRISLASNVTNTTGVFEVSDLQFQAFRTEKSSVFGLAVDCTVETQDIVPIVVGCALIALVVIVLAAYLVGRRRRQAEGYLSM